MDLQKFKDFWRERFKQEGLLWCVVFIAILLGLFFLFRKGSNSNKTVIGNIASGAHVIFKNNQEDDLSQGVYVRGGSDIKNVRGSIGVFKELGKHFEVSVGGGIQNNKDDANKGFVEVETRVRF